MRKLDEEQPKCPWARVEGVGRNINGHRVQEEKQQRLGRGARAARGKEEGCRERATGIASTQSRLRGLALAVFGQPRGRPPFFHGRYRCPAHGRSPRLTQDVSASVYVDRGPSKISSFSMILPGIGKRTKPQV